jgi:hypothetical protein
MPSTTVTFRPIPAALCERAIAHLLKLPQATTADDALALIFLAHCEIKDAEQMLPAPTPETSELT